MGKTVNKKENGRHYDKKKPCLTHRPALSVSGMVGTWLILFSVLSAADSPFHPFSIHAPVPVGKSAIQSCRKYLYLLPA